jgi:hypothetical protein
MALSLFTLGFKVHARLLNDLPFSEKARHFYEMMSGALIWEDEKPDLPSSELGWFRAALAYRTSIILHQPRHEFEPIWTALKQFAPKWPDFRPERCTHNPELVDYVNQQRNRSKRSLEHLDTVVRRRKKSLSGSQPL